MSIAAAVGKYAYVPSHKQFFVNQGRYYHQGSNTPAAGDIVIFRNESHIGIVEGCSGGYVHTIEGNTSGGFGLDANGGGVFRKTYSLTSTYIEGYGRPVYGTGEAEKLVAVALAEVGYLEKQSDANLDSKTANAGYNNYTKYGAWYGLNGQPWCDIFVSWCAEMADQNGGDTEETFEMAKIYQNGSTAETVYADTGRKTRIGSLNPWEACDCLGKIDGMYIVRYAVDGTDNHKVGVVVYSGGISA